MSFGRKGLGAQQAATPGVMLGKQSTAAAPTQPGMSPQLAAFLAQERANKPAESGLPDADIVSGGNAGGHRAAPPPVPPKERSGGLAAFGEWPMFIAYVLWWFAAPIGAHRHYLGAHKSGLVMMGLWIGGIMFILSGLSGSQYIMLGIGMIMGTAAFIWFVIDAFLIPGMVRRSDHWLRNGHAA